VNVRQKVVMNLRSQNTIVLVSLEGSHSNPLDVQSPGLVRRALDSVLAQTFRRIEPFLSPTIHRTIRLDEYWRTTKSPVSDNQSTDCTKAIVERYTNHRTRYCWYSEGRPACVSTMLIYIGSIAKWNSMLSKGSR
jgi:hypothetical protein